MQEKWQKHWWHVHWSEWPWGFSWEWASCGEGHTGFFVDILQGELSPLRSSGSAWYGYRILEQLIDSAIISVTGQSNQPFTSPSLKTCLFNWWSVCGTSYWSAGQNTDSQAIALEALILGVSYRSWQLSNKLPRVIFMMRLIWGHVMEANLVHWFFCHKREWSGEKDRMGSWFIPHWGDVTF